jgi:hypothetical protein
MKKSAFMGGHELVSIDGLARPGEPDELFMTNFTLRAYASSDADACVGVFARAWHSGHRYAPRTIDAGVFDSEVAGESVIVAETDEGRILGFAAVHCPTASSIISTSIRTPSGWGLGKPC